MQELDIAIVKATNHVERPAKEKHIRGGGCFPLVFLVKMGLLNLQIIVLILG